MMKNRCLNPNNKKYPIYGARGVKVYSEWENDFTVFLKDIGLAPGPDYSLDRINPNGDYEPGNVRWATPIIQRNNQRKPTYSRSDGLIDYRGVWKTRRQWAEILGMTPDAFYCAFKRRKSVEWIINHSYINP